MSDFKLGRKVPPKPEPPKPEYERVKQGFRRNIATGHLETDIPENEKANAYVPPSEELGD